IVIASHHTCAAMNNPFPGLKPQTERFRGPQVEALLHRFPNVVLHVAGHDLAYRITPKPDAERRTKGYWEITTGSPLDFPMQSRLVEIVANGDGTLSIFSTLYDSAAPVNPGDAHDPTPDDGANQLLLASLARQVAANDPQRFAGAYRPAASDGNAARLLPAPSEVDGAQAPSPASASGGRRLSRSAPAPPAPIVMSAVSVLTSSSPSGVWGAVSQTSPIPSKSSSFWFPVGWSLLSWPFGTRGQLSWRLR